MLLTQNDLTGLARQLDNVRREATEKHHFYCQGKTEGRDGVHGRAFLAINPETNEIKCAKCAEVK